MNRPELRFRILFEYYDELHSPERKRGDFAQNRVRNMDDPDHEKNAALVWLVDSGFVEGKNSGSLGSPTPHPFVSRINSHGINYVESVMDTAFTQTKFENVSDLSKTYKHRGRFIKHRPNTKKHWHIYYWEYDEVDEELKMYCKQVNWVTAMYYKLHKVKKIALHCPACNNDYWHFIKKRDAKHILNEECPTCFEKYRDLLEEID